MCFNEYCFSSTCIRHQENNCISPIIYHSVTTVFPNTKNDTLGLYWTGLTLLNGFSFLVNFSFLFCVVR